MASSGMQACPVCSLSGAGLPHPVAGIRGWRRRIPQDQHRYLSDRRARPTPSRALLTPRVAAALVTLNPGLHRLPPADRVASYTAWPSSGFPGSSDPCGPDRRSRTAPARPRLGQSRAAPPSTATTTVPATKTLVAPSGWRLRRASGNGPAAATALVRCRTAGPRALVLPRVRWGSARGCRRPLAWTGRLRRADE